MPTISIADRKIGTGQPCFVIAEAGVGHNGSLSLAKELVDCAALAAADAIKFQTFRAEELVSVGAPKAEYQRRTTGLQESQLEMIRRLELSQENHFELLQYCRSRGIQFLSTPYDDGAVELLNELKVPAFKIASGEITNWPFLRLVAAQGKPLILSTGMSYLGEVEEALRVVRSAGCDQIVLLHCVSNYPSDPANSNLRAMETMATAFQVPVGFSDHTLGPETSLAAVAMGACIIEKHFTVDKSLPGPDHQASASPEELRALVRGIRIIESAKGDGVKHPQPEESDVRDVARRSIVARHDIPVGVLLTREMLAFKRPGTGIPPSRCECVVGRRTARALAQDDVIAPGDLV